MSEDIEAMHIPRIGGRRSVTAGEPFNLVALVFHEMTKEHHVETISVGAEGQDFVIVELVPEVSVPKVSLPIRLEKTTALKFRVCCNKHGCWETIWPVEVTKQTNHSTKETSF